MEIVDDDDQTWSFMAFVHSRFHFKGGGALLLGWRERTNNHLSGYKLLQGMTGNVIYIFTTLYRPLGYLVVYPPPLCLFSFENAPRSSAFFHLQVCAYPFVAPVAASDPFFSTEVAILASKAVCPRFAPPWPRSSRRDGTVRW